MSGEQVETKGRLPAILRNHGPLLAAWLVVLGLLIALQGKYGNVPAYHDGQLWWHQAGVLAESPWFPFLREHDPGHPPLIAWLLALLWQLPVSRLATMHVLTWAFAALLVAAVWDSSRRLFGLAVAFVVATLTLAHPSVVAQSLQLNLDIFLAAFVWLAYYAYVRDRSKVLCLASLGIVFAKLNGLFLLGPFLIWSLGRLIQERALLDWRAWVRAFWPQAVAMGAFALYHAIKLPLTGHLFDSGEFEGGNQIRFVQSIGEYFDRVRNCCTNLFNHNGNWWVLFAAIGAWLLWVVMALVRRDWRLVGMPGERMGTVAALGLAVLIAVVHIGTQSLRGIYTLERYFMVCYPALFLLLAIPMMSAFRASQAWAAVFLILPFGGLFAAKWHPANVEQLHRLLDSHVKYLPDDVANNHENSLEFADQFYMLRRAMNRVDDLYPEGTVVKANWPFEDPATDGAIRRSKVRHRKASEHPNERVGVRLEFSVQHWWKDPTKDIHDLHPGYKLYRTYRKGRVWVAMYVPPEIPDSP